MGDKGCERFKETLKLTDLPNKLKTAAFRGPRFAGVTGDLKDLATQTALTTLAFPNSSQITGDISDLDGLAALTHLDFAGSPLLRGDVSSIRALPLQYINLASAQQIGGDLNNLPAALVYANFKSALMFTGSVDNIMNGGACDLKEIDLGSAQAGITGSLSTAAAGTTGLFERCTDLTYADLGGVYGLGAGKVVRGNFAYPDDKCVKANGLASKGCK